MNHSNGQTHEFRPAFIPFQFNPILQFKKRIYEKRPPLFAPSLVKPRTSTTKRKVPIHVLPSQPKGMNATTEWKHARTHAPARPRRGAHIGTDYDTSGSKILATTFGRATEQACAGNLEKGHRFRGEKRWRATRTEGAEKRTVRSAAATADGDRARHAARGPGPGGG